mmetsp:Transcript_28086/g.24815  ORF Transcript_28086/g.24815 Transcript_28086/m.24815 type:complete len:203 (-) Transcript_28086:32-640(-)
MKPQPDAKETISLALIWKFQMDKETIHGVHYLYKIPLNVKTYLDPNSVAEKNFLEIPLQLKLNAPKKIQHDFDKDASVEVPIQLHLSNVTGNQTLAFKLNALNSDMPLTQKEVQGSRFFIWEGVTEREFENMKPSDVISINLKAVFFEKGVYDIARFRFTFYFDRRNWELKVGLSYSDLSSNSNYLTQVFSSEQETCLIEIC